MQFKDILKNVGAEGKEKHVPVIEISKGKGEGKADIKIEQEVAAAYDRAATETEDPGLKALLLRIRDHEVYHTEVFTDLLKKEEQQG